MTTRYVLIDRKTKTIIAEGGEDVDGYVIIGSGALLEQGVYYALRPAQEGERIGDIDTANWRRPEADIERLYQEQNEQRQNLLRGTWPAKDDKPQ